MADGGWKRREVHDIRQALARDETQRGTGKVSVRVHEDDTAVLTKWVAACGASPDLHQVLRQPKQQARLAAPRLGDG